MLSLFFATLYLNCLANQLAMAVDLQPNDELKFLVLKTISKEWYWRKSPFISAEYLEKEIKHYFSRSTITLMRMSDLLNGTNMANEREIAHHEFDSAIHYTYKSYCNRNENIFLALKDYIHDSLEEYKVKSPNEKQVNKEIAQIVVKEIIYGVSIIGEIMGVVGEWSLNKLSTKELKMLVVLFVKTPLKHRSTAIRKLFDVGISSPLFEFIFSIRMHPSYSNWPEQIDQWIGLYKSLDALPVIDQKIHAEKLQGSLIMMIFCRIHQLPEERSSVLMKEFGKFRPIDREKLLLYLGSTQHLSPLVKANDADIIIDDLNRLKFLNDISFNQNTNHSEKETILFELLRLETNVSNEIIALNNKKPVEGRLIMDIFNSFNVILSNKNVPNPTQHLLEIFELLCQLATKLHCSKRHSSFTYKRLLETLWYLNNDQQFVVVQTLSNMLKHKSGNINKRSIYAVQIDSILADKQHFSLPGFSVNPFEAKRFWTKSISDEQKVDTNSLEQELLKAFEIAAKMNQIDILNDKFYNSFYQIISSFESDSERNEIIDALKSLHFNKYFFENLAERPKFKVW